MFYFYQVISELETVIEDGEEDASEKQKIHWKEVSLSLLLTFK